MGWTEARDQIADIITGTTPTTLKRGLPSTFVHAVDGHDNAHPDARAFWIRPLSVAERLPSVIALPRYFRAAIEIIVVYPSDVDQTLLFEAMMTDYEDITERLRNVALWGQPSSTIESILPGDNMIISTELEDDDDGARAVYALNILYRSS